jgi:hypothetical protein
VHLEGWVRSDHSKQGAFSSKFLPQARQQEVSQSATQHTLLRENEAFVECVPVEVDAYRTSRTALGCSSADVIQLRNAENNAPAIAAVGCGHSGEDADHHHYPLSRSFCGCRRERLLLLVAVRI